MHTTPTMTPSSTRVRLPFDLQHGVDALGLSEFAGIRWRPVPLNKRRLALCQKLVADMRRIVTRETREILKAVDPVNVTVMDSEEALGEWTKEFWLLCRAARDLEDQREAKLLFLAAQYDSLRSLRVVMRVIVLTHMQKTLVQNTRRKNKEPLPLLQLPLLFDLRTTREYRLMLERWSRELQWQLCSTMFYRSDIGWFELGRVR